MALTKDQIKKIYGESDPKKMSFFNRIKMLFLHPAHFFEGVKSENLKPAFIMFLAFFLVSNIMSAVLRPASLSSPSMSLVGILIGFVITLFFFAWTHIFARLLGGKKGIKQTFKALMYASVPITIVSAIVSSAAFILVGAAINIASPASLLNPATLFTLGIFLIIVLVLVIWAIYLEGLGLGKLHEISTGRGIGAVILLWAVLFVIFLLLAFLFPATPATLFSSLAGSVA